MSSKSLFAVLALIVVLALPFQAAQPAADDVFEGKVVSINDHAIMIMGNTNNDNKAFTVNMDTRITRNGKPGKLSDVQVGDKAKVSASGSGMNMIAKEIIANSPEGMRYVRTIWR